MQRYLLLALLGLLMSRHPAEALRFYVNQSTGDDRRSHIVAQNNTTPFRTITHALKVAHLITASRPHVIEIPAGTYSAASGETLPFEISQTGIYINSEGGVIFDGQGLSRIFTITAPTSDFLLRNVALLNGSADKGGAVYCETCSLRVTNTRLIGNKASTGDAIYVQDGRLRFFNNTLRFNGVTSGTGPLIELRNTFTDTSQRDQIRNNTFYLNNTPAVRTTGNRTDINSNIFNGKTGDGVAAIVDAVPSDDPHIRNNLFWDVDVLYASDAHDSVYVVKTVRDTVTLAELGVALPSFVTNQPDTVAKVGSVYEFDIQTTNAKSSYNFNKIGGGDLPAGMAQADWDAGILRWTPALADTGRHALRLEVIDTSGGVVDFVSYVLTVFTAENFPDTTNQGPQINISMVPDTTGAIDTLNAIIPSFSTAASSGGNRYGNPLFLNPAASRFELLTQVVNTDTSGALDTLLSVARDKGDPAVVFYDALTSGSGDRNDIGFTGGPLNAGPPTPATTSEIGATFLPDSLVVEGSTWTYSPTTTQAGTIILVDHLQGPPTLKNSLGSGKAFPITWTPTLADTGSWLVGVRVLGSGIDTRHYFPLRVRAANEPPRITSTAPTTAFEDCTFTYAVATVDLDEDPVTLTLVSAPDSMKIDAGTITWTPTQADTGSVSVEVRVTDEGGEFSSQTFILTVLNTNDAPTIAAIADTSVTEDVAIALQLSATDIDVTDTTFVFSLRSGPDSVVVDSSGQLSWTPGQADVGINIVSVQVADPQGGTDSTSFRITVAQVDDPPIITSTPDTTAPEDALYEYTLLATDEEGEQVNFALSTGPTQMSIDSTGTIRWTPTQADTGRHDVVIQASDSSSSVSQSFSLRVDAVNDAPVLVSRAPADSFFFFEPGQGIVFGVSATDEEGDALSFLWFVDGAQQSETSSQFLHVPDTTTADTVVTRIHDGTDSTIVQWVVDARAIPIALVQPDSIDFGNVLLGDSTSATLTLSNPGRTTLLISNLQVSNLELTAVFSASQVLEDEVQSLDVRYIATNRGSFATTIGFDTNDPDRSTISIPVTGFGQIPSQISLDLDPSAGDQSASTAGAAAGDSVSIDLYIRDALDITEFAAEFTYDSSILNLGQFEATGVDSPALVGTVTALVTEPSAGRVRIAATTDTTAGSSAGGLLGRLVLVVDADAVPGTQADVTLDLVELLSETFSVTDTLRPASSAIVSVRSQLPADLTGNGIVDFDDFFLFADFFGTNDARGDLNNSGGVVDFDDFFLFADSFGATARLVAVSHDGAIEGLSLRVADRPTSTDLVGAELHWDGEVDLRGVATWIEYDPRQLSFTGLDLTKDAAATLVWSRELRPGLVQVAFGRSARLGAYGQDLPTLHFERHDTQSASIQLREGLGHTAAGLQPLAMPALTTVAALPAEFLLYPVYPNPFNPATTISFFVPVGETGDRVMIRVFDLLGQPVRHLIDEIRSAGHHSVTWRGDNNHGQAVAAGVYLIEMTTPTSRIVRKALYLK